MKKKNFYNLPVKHPDGFGPLKHPDLPRAFLYRDEPWQTMPNNHGILMKYTQFAQIIIDVFSDYFSDDKETVVWQDAGENRGIKVFEEALSNLDKQNKDHYTMIELGSNNAFYSMLFKKILGPDKTINVMVEPHEKYIHMGPEHFEINNLEGYFINKQIYNPNGWCDIHFDCESTTVDELMTEYKIESLDMLHMDIDSSELIALEGSKESLSNKRIDFLYVATHSQELHDSCKLLLEGCGYKLFFEYGQRLIWESIGNDSLLVFCR